jgi:hypothetical protein
LLELDQNGQMIAQLPVSSSSSNQVKQFILTSAFVANLTPGTYQASLTNSSGTIGENSFSLTFTAAQ